jgi:hypothetical protein
MKGATDQIIVASICTAAEADKRLANFHLGQHALQLCRRLFVHLSCTSLSLDDGIHLLQSVNVIVD